METQVDPQVLDKAAGRCRDLAQRLHQAVAAVQPDSRAAVAGLGAGFALRSSLERVLASRVDEFGKFERYLGGIGEALTATAADYRHSDTASSYRFAYLREG
ncbi:type VII secretion target [Actinoplanes sp. NPDC049118]|uniref:WXG100 family type VII secretion target n=1 Tax=Actinoplanes sp. NPDC049118 TaxID=3155769 RepID=UPI0033F8E815